MDVQQWISSGSVFYWICRAVSESRALAELRWVRNAVLGADGSRRRVKHNGDAIRTIKRLFIDLNVWKKGMRLARPGCGRERRLAAAFPPLESGQRGRNTRRFSGLAGA